MKKVKKAPKQPAIQTRWVVATGATVLLLFFGYLWYRYVTSPVRVLDLTLAALKRHDADALVRLASLKEKRAMNLTSSSVEAALRDTFWRAGVVDPKIVAESQRFQYADICLFRMQTSGYKTTGQQVFDMEVYREPSGQWRLALSELLYVGPMVCMGVEGDHAPVWDEIARRSGVRGVVLPKGGIRYADGTAGPQVYLTR